MTAAVEAGRADRHEATASRLVAPLLMALSVGLLTAGTLGTVAAVLVGAGLHLLGLPDDWATIAAVLALAASLLPSAALGRRVWQSERDGPQD